MKTVSFRDNVSGRHGDVLRSSAIFYVKLDSTTRSTVSFLNYWKFKRGLEVAVLASTRTMAGALVDRRRLRFEHGEVINFVPEVAEPFEGSVEIEVFATSNMVIPYSAIVCSYETEQGFSLVHGYARAYSSHEIEEGRTHSVGKEACWTLRDDAVTQSFCVLHNGTLPVARQDARLNVRNHKGEARAIGFDLGSLEAFASVKVFPSKLVADLASFLDGQPGQASLDFKLGGGFSRMLVGNERLDGSDMQVTHSNFDYSRVPTDFSPESAKGYVVVPACRGLRKRVVVYPDCHAGTYAHDAHPAQAFNAGQTQWLDAADNQVISFSRLDGPMPTRLVTGLEVSGAGHCIPGECSSGVVTALQPPKRMWWGSVAPDSTATTHLVAHDLVDVYGGLPQDAVMELALYSAHQMIALKAQLTAGDLARLSAGLALHEIWPQAQEHLGGGLGYYTAFCAYGGLTYYSLMTRSSGSVCLEHGF